MNFAIIAAGEGSRLAQEGVELPKPLVELDGRPMIGRLLDIFAECGAENVAVCINDFMPEVKSYLENYHFPQIKGHSCPKLLVIVKTTPSSMHTMAEIGGALRGKGKWIATTVDTIFRIDEFKNYAAAWQDASESVSAMMAVTDYVDDEKPLWISLFPDSWRISGFYDSRPENVRYISGGIYGLTDNAIEVLKECMNNGVSRMRNYQRALIETGMEVEAYPMGKIIDVDHSSDILKAREFLNVTDNQDNQ